MGTWSEAPFGNDTAADWSWELDEADSWDFVTTALKGYLAEDDPDEDTESVAIAAAETVAHGVGSPTQDDSYTESVSSFVKRVGSPPAETVAAAREALRKVVAAESPLAELWSDSGTLDRWLSAIERISTVLGS